jgi:hypothetical protein
MSTISSRRAIAITSQLQSNNLEWSRLSLCLGLVGSVVVMNVLSTVLSLMI